MYTEDHEISDIYVWKASTIAGGIYLFFLIERFLKIILKIKQVKYIRCIKMFTIVSMPTGFFIWRCTLLPSFLGVHPNFWGCNVPSNSSFGGTKKMNCIFLISHVQFLYIFFFLSIWNKKFESFLTI
jgi:hypothetical protein